MDSELINQIVKQVLTAMGQTSVGQAALTRANINPGSIPPSGASASSPASPRAWSNVAPDNAAGGNAPAQPQGKKVFLTADMLIQRLAGRGENAGTLELEPNEFLTPSAEDLAADRHVAIRRRPAPLAPSGLVTSVNQAGSSDLQASPAGAASPAKAQTPCARPDAGPGFGLVTSKPSAAAVSAIRAAAHGGLTLEDWNRKGCWLRDSRTMCEAILAGTLAGGIVVLPCAADAMLLTGKIRGIRPVQGSRPESVASALRHYGANVLVIEHAFSTFHEIREMIRLFVSAQSAQDPATRNEVLMRHVGEVERS